MKEPRKPANKGREDCRHNDLGRRRAAHALSAVGELRQKSVALQGEYRTYVQSLPVTIRMNGLGQTLAMLAARSKEGYGELYQHLQHWFVADNCPLKISDIDAKDKFWLLRRVMACSQSDYLLLQEEARLYAEWLKKLGKALLNDGRPASEGGK
jgi:CRISPR type III-B/RAMP module-associated protein Cmr5